MYQHIKHAYLQLYIYLQHTTKHIIDIHQNITQPPPPLMMVQHPSSSLSKYLLRNFLD